MAVSPHNRRRRTACCNNKPSLDVPQKAAPVQELQVELMLEIAARSDAATLVRLAAACKLLRGEILTPGFVSRVCTAPPGLVPARLLSYLDKTFCLHEQDHHLVTVPVAATATTETLTPSEKKKRRRDVGFVASRRWSWEALCTRRQDDDLSRYAGRLLLE